MNYLITGGAGFIGSHVVDKLIKKNRVIILDDFSMGKRENLPNTNNLIIFGGSILDDNYFMYEGIDAIIHLAALTRPRESFDNPQLYNQVNVNGTLNVLLNAIRANVKRFLFVSSASAYGYQNRYPIYEKSIMNPASPYALTKLIGEQYCKLFSKEMRVNRVRPFNVYGPRQDPDGPYGAAVPKFINTLKNGEKPFITGDGKQFRDFIYVEDVADLIVRVIQSDVRDEVFNAGSGKHTSINSLYNTISGIMEKNVIPDYVDPVDDPNTLASVEKAERLLKWRPKFSLVEGLVRAIGGEKNGKEKK